MKIYLMHSFALEGRGGFYASPSLTSKCTQLVIIGVPARFALNVVGGTIDSRQLVDLKKL